LLRVLQLLPHQVGDLLVVLGRILLGLVAVARPHRGTEEQADQGQHEQRLAHHPTSFWGERDASGDANTGPNGQGTPDDRQGVDCAVPGDLPRAKCAVPDSPTRAPLPHGDRRRAVRPPPRGGLETAEPAGWHRSCNLPSVARTPETGRKLPPWLPK